MGGDATYGHLRIVLFDRAAAGQHCANTRAPAMSVTTRLVAGDPLRLTVGQPGAAIDTGSHLAARTRQTGRHALDESMLSSVASCCSNPTRTSIPASRKRSKAGATDTRDSDLPWLRRSGSLRHRSKPLCTAAFYRSDCGAPASRRQWRRRGPALAPCVAIACASACGSPGRCVKPSAMIWRSRTNTHPTRGFGVA